MLIHPEGTGTRRSRTEIEGVSHENLQPSVRRYSERVMGKVGALTSMTAADWACGEPRIV
jgi:hypothetical protein